MLNADNRPSAIRWSVVAMLIILLWAAFALRIEHLSEQSLWFDESSTAASLFFARIDPLLVEARAIVYLLLIAPFAAAVPTDLGLRWPSVLVGVLIVALGYRIAKKLHSDRAGLIAAALFTISSQFIHYSREARYYSIVPFVALITLWLALRLTPKRQSLNRWFVASVMLLTGLHLITVLWIAVLLIALALRPKITGKGARWGVLIAAALGTAITIIGLYMLGTLGQTRLTQGVTDGAVDSPQRLLVAFLTTGWGMIMPSTSKMVSLGLFLSLLTLGLWRISWIRQWPIILLGSLTLLPVLSLIALTHLYQPIFLYRYLMPSFATLILLTAIILAHINARWVAHGALGVLLISGILAYVIEPDRQREDWRGVAAYLERHMQSGDQVFACRLRAAMPLVHYLPDLNPHYLGEPDDVTALIQDHIQPAPDRLSNQTRIWLVQNDSVPCTLAQYGMDASALDDVPSDIVHFKHVTLFLFHGVRE